MIRKRLSEIVSAFPEKKVAVIGDVMLDWYIYGDASRPNPEKPGSPLLLGQRHDYRPGGAANAAVNASSLGSQTTLVSVLGKDQYGDQLAQLCKKEKVEFEGIRHGSTIKKIRGIEKEHMNYLFRLDLEEGPNHTPESNGEWEDNLFRKIKNINPDGIIFSDYNKKIFQGNLGGSVIEWARSNNVISVVDPHPSNPNIDQFQRATIVRPNLSETRSIVGNSTLGKEEAVRQLYEKMKSTYAIVTCSSEGMICYDGKYHEIPTCTRQITDVTGAGDTVVAALTLSFLAGANLQEAATIANYAAGIVVEKQGTATATQEELLRRISEK